MIKISAKTFAENSNHTISQLKRGKELISWLRIEDVEVELDVENIYNLVDKEIKGKFETNYPTKQIRKDKRHRSQLIENEKLMYAHERIIILLIMHCRVATPESIEFRSKLGFNQYDITPTKEQSVLKPVMDAFDGETMQTQCIAIG